MMHMHVLGNIDLCIVKHLSIVFQEHVEMGTKLRKVEVYVILANNLENQHCWIETQRKF